MRVVSLVAASLSAAVVLAANHAAACGGCFHPPPTPMEMSQVVGHRMVLSISKQQTTLWDQIKYDGNPKEFAWVLPVKGMVDIQLSSDLLFNELELLTNRVVSPEAQNCAQPPLCTGTGGSTTGTTTSSSGSSSSGGVTVVASSVIGPYETVVLHSTDPKALENWLASHSYEIPPDVQPIVGAYVTEGFDFLAMKLLPTSGIDEMRPVRVTTAGASPVLPLRMVAAGTGVKTAVSLWVIGEGLYEPKNLPSFRIDPSALTWDWLVSKSNYDELEQAGFAKASGKAWNLVSGEPLQPLALRGAIDGVTLATPESSGYGDPSDGYAHAKDEETADLDTLFQGIAPGSTTFTRMHAELARPALVADLQLGASANQKPLQRSYVVPLAQQQHLAACPVVVPCPPSSSSGFGVGSSTSSGSGGASSSNGEGSSCAVAVPWTLEGGPLWLLAGAAVGLGLRRRRGRR